MNTLGKYALFVSIQLSVVALATAVYSVYKMNECRAKMDVHYVHCATKHNAIDDQIRMIKDGGKAEAYIDSHRYYAGKIDGLQERVSELEKKYPGVFNADCETQAKRYQALTNAMHSLVRPSRRVHKPVGAGDGANK